MPRTKKTVRQILESLFDMASRQYPYWNYTDKAPQKEINQALLELQEVIVPEEKPCPIGEHTKNCPCFECVGNWHFNQCRTEVLFKFSNGGKEK